MSGRKRWRGRTNWGCSGWPSCEQRIEFLRDALRQTVTLLVTPKYWRFSSPGWGELACCWPRDVLERRKLYRQDAGDNSPKLLGLPYFVEADADFHPFILEVEEGWDDVAALRIHHWLQDPAMASLRDLHA